jgi:hypothetical protein
MHEKEKDQRLRASFALSVFSSSVRHGHGVNRACKIIETPTATFAATLVTLKSCSNMTPSADSSVQHTL